MITIIFAFLNNSELVGGLIASILGGVMTTLTFDYYKKKDEESKQRLIKVFIFGVVITLLFRFVR